LLYRGDTRYVETTGLSWPVRPAIAHVSSRDFSAVVVCVGAGSRNEAANCNGVAHLIEHAVFLGAGERDYRSIRATIDRLGGDVSAETGEEMILYWGSANEERDFPECLDLVADLVLAPSFDPDSVKREAGTVIQEISGAGDDIFQVVVEGAKGLLWPDSSLGRPVGGKAAIIKKLDAAACREYWAATHQGERMFVLVVGTAAESRLARKRFAAEFLRGPVAELASPAGSQAAPSPSQQRFRGILMAGAFVRLCFALPGVAWSDPRLLALDLANGVLGRDETSHLWERIRGQGLSYSTESFVDCFSDTGWLGVLTDAPVDAADEVVRIVRDEIASLAQKITSDELEQARASHIARIRNDEQAAPMEWAKYQAMHAYFLGRVPSVDSLVRELERVTLDDVRSALAGVLAPERLVLCAGGPRASVQKCAAAFGP